MRFAHYRTSVFGIDTLFALKPIVFAWKTSTEKF